MPGRKKMKIHHWFLLAAAIATCLLLLAETPSRSLRPASHEPAVAIPWGGSS